MLKPTSFALADSSLVGHECDALLDASLEFGNARFQETLLVVVDLSEALDILDAVRSELAGKREVLETRGGSDQRGQGRRGILVAFNRDVWTGRDCFRICAWGVLPPLTAILDDTTLAVVLGAHQSIGESIAVMRVSRCEHLVQARSPVSSISHGKLHKPVRQPLRNSSSHCSR